MVAKGRSLDMAIQIVDSHPITDTSVLCDENGVKNPYGQLLADLHFRDGQIINMSVHDTILNLAQGYRGLNFSHAALVRYVNDNFLKRKMVDHKKNPIITAENAISFALRDTAMFLGDNASLVLKFMELLRSYAHPEIVFIAALVRKKRSELGQLHTTLEGALQESYGQELGEQFANAADGLVRLSLDQDFMRENRVGGIQTKDFLLLSTIAAHEIQIPAMVNRNILNIFKLPRSETPVDIDLLGNRS